MLIKMEREKLHFYNKSSPENMDWFFWLSLKHGAAQKAAADADRNS